MVADKVEVTSRKAGTEAAFTWTSDGKGEYSIEAAQRVGQGTEVRRPPQRRGPGVPGPLERRVGAQEVLQPHRLSDHPRLRGAQVRRQGREGGQRAQGGGRSTPPQALWRRPKSELKDEDYVEFYKSFTGAGLGGFGGSEAEGEAAPLHWIHTKAEGTIEYTTLFYIPSKAPFDLYRADYRPGVKLYVKRVFITDDEKELLPVYLRFVRGIIDSEDLPLNVSREILQQNRVMTEHPAGERQEDPRRARRPRQDQSRQVRGLHRRVQPAAQGGPVLRLRQPRGPPRPRALEEHAPRSPRRAAGRASPTTSRG